VDEVKPQVLEMPVRLEKENLVDRIGVVDVSDIGRLRGELATLGDHTAVRARFCPSGIDEGLQGASNGGSADMESFLQFLLSREKAARRENRLPHIFSQKICDILVPVLSGGGLR
jgi:hypothetical protein